VGITLNARRPKMFGMSSDAVTLIFILRSAAGKNALRIGVDDRGIAILKAGCGDRVHMQSGYFRAGGATIKFF